MTRCSAGSPEQLAGLSRRAGGHDAELLHERQHVGNAPVLADQAVTVEPHNVDELHVHALAGRRHADELAFVRSGELHARHGLVSFRDQVLDGHTHIGKGGQQDPEELQRPLLRERKFGSTPWCSTKSFANTSPNPAMSPALIRS